MNLTEDEANEVMDEMSEHFPPQRQPGDIDRMMFAEHEGISITSAGARLNKLVDTGHYVSLIVFDPVRKSKVRVYRKA